MAQAKEYQFDNGRRRRRILQAATAVLLMGILSNLASALPQDDPLVGWWQLDDTRSTESSKELKGIRENKRIRRSEINSGQSRGPGSATMRRYWQHANEGKQWKHSKELAHAGPLQRIIESENLEILRDETGYLIIYADGFERRVIPNPGGRVFTASGDELVETAIGFTLAYWEQAVLVLETRIKAGGKLTERISTSPTADRLTIKVEIDRRDWKWVAKLDRIFDRVPITQ